MLYLGAQFLKLLKILQFMPTNNSIPFMASKLTYPQLSSTLQSFHIQNWVSQDNCCLTCS
jgi:hypothetical protein